MNRQTDRHEWKHYLPATSLADSNKDSLAVLPCMYQKSLFFDVFDIMRQRPWGSRVHFITDPPCHSNLLPVMIHQAKRLLLKVHFLSLRRYNFTSNKNKRLKITASTIPDIHIIF